MRAKLGKFGLGGQHHLTPICKLSGGQKARVVFTAISLTNAHILLLDEPTNHLDMQVCSWVPTVSKSCLIVLAWAWPGPALAVVALWCPPRLPHHSAALNLCSCTLRLAPLLASSLN